MADVQGTGTPYTGLSAFILIKKWGSIKACPRPAGAEGFTLGKLLQRLNSTSIQSQANADQLNVGNDE